MMETMIGIDPHKATHTAVAISRDEGVLGELKVRACPAQVERLRDWAATFDEPVWAIESAGGLGYLLAQQLVAAGETVFDVSPMLAARVRLLGSAKSQKNDSNDALSVAVAALRSKRLTQVRPDDHASVLRMLAKRHRDLGRAKNRAASRLHALLLELTPGGARFRMYTVARADAILDTVEVVDEVGRQRVDIAREHTDDIARLDAQLKASKKRITAAVAASGTCLVEISGVGPICAAQLIGYTGDIARFPSRGHYASYNATAPTEASSSVKNRHRLNPRGNRQLNWAIHIAAISQISHPGPGRDYYERKRDEGKSSKEAIRCLKRRLSDVVYRHLVADAARAQE
jgi:transposase